MVPVTGLLIPNLPATTQPMATSLPLKLSLPTKKNLLQDPAVALPLILLPQVELAPF